MIQSFRVQVATLLVALVSSELAAAQDTVRVRADGPPLWGIPVRLVQELAIGQLDGPPEYAFGRVYAMAAEPGGAFYVYDFNDRQIRRYDARGTFTNLVGKRGGGPGEYQHPGGMAVTRDGLLIVFDPENSRITYFHPDGKVQRDFPVVRPGFFGNDLVTDNLGLIYQPVAVGGRLTEGYG